MQRRPRGPMDKASDYESGDRQVRVLARSSPFFLYQISVHRLPSYQYSGSQRGGCWSPGVLKFLLWSPKPDHFTDWSSDRFLTVEPGARGIFPRSQEHRLH